MISDTVLAYLAGAIDSDGSIGIKRQTYHKRVRKDATNPTYSERVMLKQVTPEIPHLLKECFGGYLRLERPSTKDGKPLWSWQATDKQGANAARLLLPFLRVKKRQAELLLELRESKSSKYWQPSYWFLKRFPNWQNLELITIEQATSILHYRDSKMVGQAIRNGALVALPYDHSGIPRPRIPRPLVEYVAAQRTDAGKFNRPPELIEWRERLCENLRQLNKTGVNGGKIYRREGSHAPIE